MMQPSTCLCGLTWMILLKVSWLLPNLEVYGERVTLMDLASLSIVLLRVFIEMATISKVVFLVHLWGANYQPFDNCVLMALLFLAPVYAEYVMWIWSATMHLLYVFLYSFNLKLNNFSFLSVYFFNVCCKYDLFHWIFLFFVCLFVFVCVLCLPLR